MNDNEKPADGLRGSDQRQGDLRDVQGGTYGVTPSGGNKRDVAERQDAHQGAQGGADLRPEPVVSEDDLPAGLRQERKGPLNPSSGRR